MDFSRMTDEELEEIAYGDGERPLDFSRMTDEELEAIAGGNAPQAMENGVDMDFGRMSDEQLEMIANGTPIAGGASGNEQATRQEQVEPSAPSRNIVGKVGAQMAPGQFASEEQMGGATQAALENQAKYGIAGEAAEDDGSLTNWAKNVGTTAANMSFGRMTATDTIANAQALLRGEVNGVKLEDLPDEETDYLVDATGMNGFMSYMSVILPKSWRGARGQMEEWDNTTGSRIADPVERKRQRVAWAKGLAQGMIEQNEEAKRLAEAELVGRESNWTSEFTGGLLSNGAYMVPFAIGFGTDKGVIAGLVEGTERFNELRQDKYGVDADGNIYVEAERDDDLSALGKGAARGVMAPLVEKAGGKVLKPFTYVLGKIPLVMKAGEKIVETTAGKAVNRYMNTLKSFTKLTGMHSFPEEVLEEYEDQVMDAAFGTDRRKSEMGDSTMSSRFADAHSEFMKPENLVKLAKSMALIQMVGGGAAHVADARLARYADGMLTKIAGIDEEKLKGYTGEEKAAAFKAWVANMSEEDVEEAFDDGTRSIKELLSAIREKSGNFDFSQADGVQDENRVFAVPTVQNEKGETVPDFKNVEDSAGRTVRRMTDNASGISIDELTDADGKVSYKVRGALGRVRSASTVEKAKNLADQMAKRSALNDRKIAYLNTLREQGRALSGTDVIAGDTLREALDAFGNKYGEEAKRKLMGGEEYQRGYNAKNPSLHYTLDDGSDVVLVNLSGIDNAAQMQNFATHEAITHSGLDMLFSDPKMRAQFLESVGVTGDMGKGDFLSQIDQEAFEKVDKQQFDAVVKAQMRQRGFSSADQVFADDAAREEVMAWVTERLHASPSMKNKVVAAVRKMYRRNFKTDLKFNADEVATMFDALRGMATQREGGELRYRSVEQSAERDKANANAVMGEIRANAEAQPLQLENKAIDGEKILMDMQGKAVGATNVDAPSATTDAAPSATDQTEEQGPSVTPVEPAPATTKSEATVQQTATTTSAPSSADVVQSFKDYSDADLDAYIDGLKQFEMLNDAGKKNLANAEKEKARRAKEKAKREEAEKKAKAREEAARKKAEAEEKKFKEDDERAFQAWLKRHPGRKDSKAARDDYERDLSGAIADVCRSIANGHGKELPSVHLKAVLRRLADDNAKRWNFKVGDGAFNLEGMLEQMDKAGKLFGDDGLMILAPFNGMVEQAYPSVRQGAKDKVARRLRAFFGPMWLSHRQAIADKNNASYAGLAQQRSAQARRNLVDREKNRVNGFVRGYIASHPGTVLEGWHDYWNGECNSADAIEEVYDVDRDGWEFDQIMSEMGRLAPGTVQLDADGNVDHTQFEKTKQALLNELDRAVAWGEANEAADTAVEAEDVREGAGAEVEGWERIRDERPSWWGKEPWDMTEAEERDFDRYNEESGAADDAANAEVEELGLSPDETPKGVNAMWRTATEDEQTRLDGEKTIKLYRAMQLIDGKLYPLMAAKVDGKFVDGIPVGDDMSIEKPFWQVADEPTAERIEEMIKNNQIVVDEDGKLSFKLDKGNGKSIFAAYNPYWHMSNRMLNDQFDSVYQRPNIVVVEVEAPVSEDGAYWADRAKNMTGWTGWHSGPVATWLEAADMDKGRNVFLSRYCKVLRVVPNADVAESIRDLLDGTNIQIPTNVVTPSLRAELEKLGVPMFDTIDENGGFDKSAYTKMKNVEVKKLTKGYSKEEKKARKARKEQEKAEIARKQDALKGSDVMWRAANIDPEAVRIAGPKAEKVFRSLLGSGPAEVRWRTAMEDKDLNLGKMSEHMRRERTVKFADGDEDKTGAESIVVRSGDGETVTKYRDAKDWTDEDVQKIAYHNELFGDATPYTVEGMVDDDGWDDKTRTTPRIVLRQPYVHILNGAGIEARRQLLAAMERRFGAENVTTTGTIDQQYKFSIKAGPYTITDLKDMNIGIDERDGKFRVWDCTIEKDEVGEKKNPDVTDSTSSAGVESQSGVDSPFLGAVRRPSKDQTKTKSSISVDGRFIKPNIRDYKNGDFNVDTSSAESAMRSLSKMLSMRREGGSRYVTYVVEVGSTTVRLSDHNADGRYFVNDPADAYVSVIIGDDVHKDAHSHVPVMEWRYPSATFAENPKAVVDSIVNGVSQIIDGGTFTADQNLAKFNLVEADVSDKDARKYVDEKNEERSKFIRRKGNTDIQWRTYTPYPGLRSMADALGLSTEELDVLMGGSSFIAGRTLRQTMFPTEAALVGAISDEGGAKGVLKSARNLMSELSSPGAKGKWNALLDGLRRRLTDYMLPVLRMEQWIGAKSGSKVGVSESVHDAAKFAFGRQTHMMNTVHQKFLEPLKRLIAANKLNEKSKYVAGNDVLTDILLALHGPAFNRMISERTNGNDLAGSGKSTEFWVDLLRKYGAQGSRRQILAALSAGNYAGLNFAAGSVGEKAADAVAKVMEMNKWTRQLLVDTGRLSAAQRDLWERESPFYVPLRFDMENDQNFMETFFYGKTKDEGIYTRNYTQGESKHAFGHDGVSDSPIAFSIQQCETAIVRATDNEVRAKLAALVRRHAELGEVIDPNDPAQSWKLPTTNVLGQNGKSHTVPDVNGIESKYGNIVAFKEGGNLKFIVLGRRPNAGTATTTNRAEADNLPQKDGELIGRAVKKQTLVEPGNVIRAVRAATRMFGILRTSASPEFLVSNFLADNGQAARNIYADFGFGAAKRFEGFVPKAVMTARRLINGNLGTSVLDRYAQEMQEDGGLIGGLATENFRDIEKQIENDVKLFAGDRKARVIDFLTKLGERLNGPVELSTRIAAYAAVREQLKTDTSKTDKEKRAIAAKYAREVTVDFNQKGEWTPVLNALYAFSNASLVDMERSMGAFLAKKGGRMAIGLFLVGFLSSLVGYWQDNPDDEREGKAQWKDTKDYRKQNQMGFRVGDKYVSMPVRGLSRVCYYAGHKAYEVMAGKTGAVDAGMDMGGFIASNVFDPIGDVTKPAQAITPSVARPAMELVQNESFSGAQIYRQPMDSRQVRSEMGRQSTPSAWHAIARGLNSLTGGNRVRRGLVDVQPEILQHYYSWLTGSAGNDVARATNLVADVARWNFDDMEARNVPFMRRFVGGLDQNSATFRELQDAFKVDMDEYKEIAPTDPDVRMELANRHGYFGDGHRAQRWREELDDLQKAQRNLMKMEMKADGQDKKDIHDLRMKVQAAFIYRTEHAPETDDADRRSFDRSRNRIVDKAIAKNKREEKAAANERERELRRNRIVK